MYGRIRKFKHQIGVINSVSTAMVTTFLLRALYQLLTPDSPLCALYSCGVVVTLSPPTVGPGVRFAVRVPFFALQQQQQHQPTVDTKTCSSVCLCSYYGSTCAVYLCIIISCFLITTMMTMTTALL
jgi:hypothetical protein